MKVLARNARRLGALMGRATLWVPRLRRALVRGICAVLGHRPVAYEAERRELNSDPQWRFRCGDCGRRYWWP